MSVKYLTVLIIFASSLACKEDYPRLVHLKCIPFQSTSPIPIHENIFDAKDDKPTFTFMVKKDIREKEKIKQISNLLQKLVRSTPNKLEDYDLRASIQLEGINDRYYLNWDKKYILFKNKFYSIGEVDFQTLSNSIELCK